MDDPHSDESTGTGELLRFGIKDVRGLIATLNEFCFHAGEERFRRERGAAALPADFFEVAPPDTVREFLRCTNWSLKEAQSIIIRRRLGLETAHRERRVEFEAPFTFGFVIGLLTDYANTLGWMLLEYDMSRARSQFLDFRQNSDLDRHNWESVDSVLTELNRDPDQMALATDLTSFMQIGDIFFRNMRTGKVGPIEVKSGSENERVLKVLSAETTEQFEQRMLDYVESAEKPKHALQQLERNLKQYARMNQSQVYITSGNSERVDLKSEKSVAVHESGEPEESWKDTARQLAEGLEADDARLAVVDGCLFCEYGRTPHTNLREMFFRYRVSSRLGLSSEPENYTKLRVFDVAQYTAMPGFEPLTTCLLGLGEENQSRLLALDDHLFVYLHMPALQAFLRSNDVSLTVRNMRAAEQQYRDRIMRDVIGNNKVAVIKTDHPEGASELVLTGGLFGRIIFNFLAPRTIIDMSSLL